MPRKLHSTSAIRRAAEIWDSKGTLSIAVSRHRFRLRLYCPFDDAREAASLVDVHPSKAGVAHQTTGSLYFRCQHDGHNLVFLQEVLPYLNRTKKLAQLGIKWLTSTDPDEIVRTVMLINLTKERIE